MGHGPHSSIFVLFYVLFVLCRTCVLCLCKCALCYCHRVATQLQLNISYIIASIHKPAANAFLGLLDPELGDRIIRNVQNYSPIDSASHSRRPEYCSNRLWPDKAASPDRILPQLITDPQASG